MRLGIVLSTQSTDFSALAYQGALADNARKIRKLGFDGIELAIRDPELVNGAEILEMLAELGLTVPAIGTGQAFGVEGLSFIDPNQNIRRQAIRRIKSQVQLAKQLGAQVIIGLIRGINDGKTHTHQTEIWLVEALRECAREDEEVRLVIEPINRYECNQVLTVAEGLELLEKVDFTNVGLLLDTFHMNIEEPSIYRSIEQAGDKIFHFHVADSNRWYPGAGHLDFPKIVSKLRDVGYDGFLSAEILPEPDPDTAAEKTASYLRTLI